MKARVTTCIIPSNAFVTFNTAINKGNKTQVLGVVCTQGGAGMLSPTTETVVGLESTKVFIYTA